MSLFSRFTRAVSFCKELPAPLTTKIVVTITDQDGVRLTSAE